MDRPTFRSQIAAAIAGLFDLVSQGAPDTFNGAATVAVITSAATEPHVLARDLDEDMHLVSVGIYVQRAASGGEAAEDALDSLSRQAIAAIRALDPTVAFQRSDAGGTGAPNRRVDGKMHRYERILCSVLDEV